MTRISLGLREMQRYILRGVSNTPKRQGNPLVSLQNGMNNRTVVDRRAISLPAARAASPPGLRRRSTIPEVRTAAIPSARTVFPPSAARRRPPPSSSVISPPRSVSHSFSRQHSRSGSSMPRSPVPKLRRPSQVSTAYIPWRIQNINSRGHVLFILEKRLDFGSIRYWTEAHNLLKDEAHTYRCDEAGLAYY